MNKAYIFISLGIIVMATACNRNSKPKIAFVAGAATDFWTIAEAGCKKADQELENFDVVFKYTTDGATQEQKRIIEDLQVIGVKGIIISPLDPINQGPMIDAVSANIPVVITDSDIPGSKRLCYVGTSNVEAGRSAGKLIKEAIPNGGKIMLFVGKTDAQNASERILGIKEEIAGTSIEIVDIKTDNIDRVRAKANVSDALVSYPDLQCLVGLWSYNGPAILNAVKESGKKINIVCFDEEEETLNGVKDGDIYGTIVQQPYEFGYRSVHLLADYLSGKNTVPQDKKIIIPVQIIKKQEAPAYIEKMKLLRSQK
jgi:ribose transport system substrate-binding protein